MTPQQSGKTRLTDKDDRALLLEAWKAIVSVQMHFNEVLMKVRNLAMTLILAVFGAAAFSLQYELYFRAPWGRIHIATLIVTFGLVAWCSMCFMDRYYNKLLAGAVAQSTAIEEQYEEDWLGMTHHITKESRTLFGLQRPVRARTQMLWFLYLPILIVGLFYILVIALYFQPPYGRSADGAPSLKAIQAPQAGSVPSTTPAHRNVPALPVPAPCTTTTPAPPPTPKP